MIKQLSLIKMRSNLFTGGLNQLVLADLIKRGSLDKHLDKLRSHHRELCETTLGALETSLRAGLLRCRVPSGGLYLWYKVLGNVDMERLFANLEANGLSVAPGMAFEPERKGRSSSHFRLCFTVVPRAKLIEGIEVLNRTLSDHYRNAAPASEA